LFQALQAFLGALCTSGGRLLNGLPARRALILACIAAPVGANGWRGGAIFAAFPDLTGAVLAPLPAGFSRRLGMALLGRLGGGRAFAAAALAALVSRGCLALAFLRTRLDAPGLIVARLIAAQVVIALARVLTHLAGFAG